MQKRMLTDENLNEFQLHFVDMLAFLVAYGSYQIIYMGTMKTILYKLNIERDQLNQ